MNPVNRLLALILVGLVLSPPFLPSTRAAANPHRSSSVLTVANGYGAATYVSDDGSGRTHSIHGLYEHVYRYPEEGIESVDLCFDAFFGLRAGGSQIWCQELSESQLGYLDGGIVHSVQSHGGLRLDTYYFAPFDRVPDSWERPGNLLVLAARLSNPTGTTVSSNRLFALLNFHTGAGRPDPGHAQETIQWQPGADTFVESSTDSSHRLAYAALPGPDRHATSGDDPAENPWTVVAGGGSLTDRDFIGPGSDRVAAFQWDLPDLAPGQEAWAAVVIGYSGRSQSDLLAALEEYISDRTAQQLLVHEQSGWQSWLGGCTFPSGLSPDETALLRQQAALLRMSQCREGNLGSFRPHGQIPACLPPGMWAMSWVRDAAYAIRALVRLERYDMARDALDFFLQGATGDYRSYQYEDQEYGVRRDYSISVCRTFGSGREESDGGADPNIEWDNFGLFLGALGEYVLASGDQAYLLQNEDAIDRRCAHVLASLVEPGGLLPPDSSCWERHLAEALHYGYSHVTAAWGLERLALALHQAGQSRDAARYAGAAASLKGIVLGELTNSGSELIGAAGYPIYCDAALGEAIGLGLLHPAGEVSLASLDAFRDRLWQPTTDRGYQRLDGRPLAPADWYDLQEWVFLDLRLSDALRQAGRSAQADELLDWVTGQARMNFDLIPELFTREAADYEGASPMMGFGAGAYALTLFGREPAPTAELRGRITRAGSGAAAGAGVVCLSGGEPVLATVTEPDGWYRAAGLPPGSYELLARVGSGAVTSGPFELAAGQIRELDLVIPVNDPPGHGSASPGSPGQPTRWTTGRKLGFGTARGDGRVWFSVGEGRLSETAFPRVDRPALREIRLLVTDGSTFCHDATLDCLHSLERLHPDAPVYRVSETDPAGRYRLDWTPLPDPDRDILYLRLELTVLQGSPEGYRVYLLLDPHLRLDGAGDRLEYLEWDGAPLILASDRDVQVALGGPAVWAEHSCGFAGSVSDPRADLLAGAPYQVDQPYHRAGPGHVLALVGLDSSTGTPVDCFLAFGHGPGGALATVAAAREGLAGEGFDGLRDRFEQDWAEHAASLMDLTAWSEDGGAVFRAAWLGLACAEDKQFPGAVVASPSFAWGQDQDEGRPTYQKVWGRDLGRSAAGFLAAGDLEAALRCLDHLDRIQQEEDGSLPQHGHLDGYREPGQTEQLDETAAPILLAWRLREAGALEEPELTERWESLIRPAAEFLRAASPSSGQERWEEEWGWSPATLAAMTAGLVAAADLADAVGAGTDAGRYRSRADQLESMVETTTFTTSGGLGDGRYYLRIDQAGDPDDEAMIEINSGGGWHREKDILSADFLELVRLGVRRARDSHVLETLPEVDATIRRELPGGSGFHRYNHDGYGEKDDGSTFLADPPFTGRGRLWPILTGERAHRDLAAGEDVAGLVAALESFATDGGLLPEQIWEAPDLPGAGLYRGKATNAVCPLSWSAAEYLSLLRSRREGRIFGRIDPAYARYANLEPVITAAAAEPDRVEAGGDCLLTVTAEDLDGRIVLAEVDGSELELGVLPGRDDGTDGDLLAGDGIWSVRVTVPPGAPPADLLLPCRVEDEVGAEDRAEIDLEVLPPGGAPRILAAGYAGTRLTRQGGQLTVWAWLDDPDGPADPVSVELYLDGEPTGVFLLDDGTQGDGAAGDGLFGLAVPVAGPVPALPDLELEIRAVDTGGRTARWPALVVP